MKKHRLARRTPPCPRFPGAEAIGTPTVSAETASLFGLPVICITEEGRVLRAPTLTVVMDIDTRTIVGSYMQT